ncbi:MAG: hypothetical protein RLZZ613_1905, partial [Pseudomonadota bacterium]
SADTVAFRRTATIGSALAAINGIVMRHNVPTNAH